MCPRVTPCWDVRQRQTQDERLDPASLEVVSVGVGRAWAVCVEHEAHGDHVPKFPVGPTVVAAEPALDGEAAGAVQGYRRGVVGPHSKVDLVQAGLARQRTLSSSSRPPMPCPRCCLAIIMPSEPTLWRCCT